MRLEDIVNQAQDAISVRRVFGKPVTHDGVMVIPVASVAAGAGGGSGSGGDTERGGQGEGEGGGFGARGRPIGVYVIRDGEVSWRPALDLNRAIVWANVAVTALLLLLSRRRRHAR
jgi:uncharacterized spore protein YtfJ